MVVVVFFPGLEEGVVVFDEVVVVLGVTAELVDDAGGDLGESLGGVAAEAGRW